MIKEHDCVTLLLDLPARGLHRGDVGVVVHLFSNRGACSVEFFDSANRSRGVVDVRLDEVMRLNMDVRLSA